jgi:small subunit ribosomal protein S16
LDDAPARVERALGSAAASGTLVGEPPPSTALYPSRRDRTWHPTRNPTRVAGAHPTPYDWSTNHVATKIKLMRLGKMRAPYYRIVVADARTKRDGRVIETIGKYHPKENPSFIEVDAERAAYWLGVGAQPTDPVQKILSKTGDWQRFKGEPAPEPLLVREPRIDKRAVFEAAALESAATGAATTPAKKKTPKKDATPEAATEAPAAETATEAPAAEAPAAEAVEAPVEAAPEAAAEQTPAAAAEAPAAEAVAETAPAETPAE